MEPGTTEPRAEGRFRRPWAGRFLFFCGILGLLTGGVPLAVSVCRLLEIEPGRTPQDWSAHGVEALGLTVPWAAISSANGAFLGGLLVAAGIGWLRGRSWAPLVTLIYGLLGALITGLDILIFATAGRPGAVRTWMLVLDGLACALAVGVLAWLWAWRRRA